MVEHAPCTYENVWLSLACNWRELDGSTVAYLISGIFPPSLKIYCKFILQPWLDAALLNACAPLCVPSYAVVAMAGFLELGAYASQVEFGGLGSVVADSLPSTARLCRSDWDTILAWGCLSSKGHTPVLSCALSGCMMKRTCNVPGM